MKTVVAFLIVISSIISCGKKPIEIKVSNEKMILEFLQSKKWAGTIDGQPAELQFNDQGASLMYTYFGEPGVEEKLSIEVTGDGNVTMRGTSYKRIGGFGEFYLDTLTGKLSNDSTTLEGKVPVSGGKVGTWALSSKQTIAQIDSPLDMGTVKDILVKGQWQGRVDDKPAKLIFQKKGDNLTAQMTYGTSKANLSVAIKKDGTIIMKAQDRPTAQGLMKESFEGQITNDFRFLHGEHSTSIKQGFVESSYGGQWVLENVRKK